MKHLLTLALLALMATGAQAATVTYSLMIDEDGPGTFNLYATTGNDNFGIALYGAPLLGGITSVDHNSPAALSQLGQDVGWRVFRSPDGSPNIGAGQNTLLSPHIIKGFGQTAGNLADAPGVTALIIPESPAYDANLLLASGTWESLMPSFNLASVDLLASVFTSATTNDLAIADVATVTTVVPEPGTVVLASLAGVALVAVARRRRRS